MKITRQKFSQKHLIKEFGLKLGQKLWNLLHGIDEETVKQSPDCPKQVCLYNLYMYIQRVIKTQ